MSARVDSQQRSVLPIADRAHVGLITYDAKDPDTTFRRSSRCGRRRAHRTCCWCCSTMSGSERRARSAGRSTRRSPTGWRVPACATPGSIRRRSARRRGPRC